MENLPEAKPKASLADYLAAERTLLAWIRTGLALMGFGFVVARFGLFLQELQVARGIAPRQAYGLSLWFGTVLIFLGVLLNIFSGYRHLQLIRRLDRGETSQPHSAAEPVSIAFFLAAVGIAMALYLILIRG